MKNFSLKIYNIIRDDEYNTLSGRIFDYFIVILILINVILVIGDTFESSPQIIERIGYPIELLSIIIFTIEYSLRVWTSNYIYPSLKPWKARIKYIFSFLAVIDLLSIVPFYLPFITNVDLRILRLLRLLRIIRILKLNRYSDALLSIEKVLKNKAPQLLSAILVLLILLVVASVLMYHLEHEAQPEVFENAFSGLWWTLVTISTVAYDDIIPITAIGKMVSVAISLLGLALVAIPTGIISAGFIEYQKQEQEKENKNKN